MRHAISRRTAPHLRVVCLILSSFILLTACGGGGGSSGSGPVGGEPPVLPPPPPPPPPSPPPPAQAQWSTTPTQIDSPAAAGAADRPVLVSDASGNVTAAWTQVQNGRVGVNSSTYRAATASWSAPVPLESPDAGDAGRPALAVDSGGNVIVMWSQADSQALSTIYARRYVAAQGNWSAIEVVRTAVGAENPVLVVDRAGILTAAWAEHEPGSGFHNRLVSSRFHEGSWSAPVQLSSPDTWAIPFEAVLVVDASGKVFAAWTEEPLTGTSFITINASRFDGAGWSLPVRLDNPVPTPTGSYSYAPALVADAAGGVMLAWLQEDLAGVSVFASRFDGGAWGAPTRVNAESTSGGLVRLVADSAGDVNALWDGFTLDNVHHVSSSRFSALSGEWSTPVQISHPATAVAQLTTTSLAAGPDGDLVAVWTGVKTRSTIVSSRYVAALNRWETPQQIDGPAAAGDASSPVVTLDGAGKATAAWVQLQGGRAVINANRFE